MFDTPEPKWKKMVERLSEEGYQSPLLDYLRGRLQARSGIDHLEAAHSKLQQEILQEMASSLGRAEEKVVAALLELEVLNRVPQTEHNAEHIKHFNAKREDVVRFLYELIVTREAVGLRNHDLVRRLYPVPPRLG
jgi:hypothetical protein